MTGNNIIFIDDIKCVVQAYLKDEFINICPVLSYNQLNKMKGFNGLPMIKIYLDNRTDPFFTDGKKDKEYYCFIQKIDIKLILNQINE